MKRLHACFLAMATLTMTSAAMAAEAADSYRDDTGFDAGLFFAILIFGLVLLVLIGIGFAIGLACVACAAVLVSLGVVSSSVLIGLVRRRFASGLRAFHYQALALIGWPCGVGAFWLGYAVFDLHFRQRYVLLTGSIAGILAGLLVAYLLDLSLRYACRRFTPVVRARLTA
jgi:hypothetical protein